MNALDTNVLVRFLVGDDQQMMLKAKAVLEQAQEKNEPLLITTPVLLEMLWVLKARYGLSREDILDALGKLALIRALSFESSSRVHELVHIGSATRFDLADILIGLHAQGCGCTTTFTFDKRVAKSELFELLG